MGQKVYTENRARSSRMTLSLRNKKNTCSTMRQKVTSQKKKMDVGKVLQEFKESRDFYCGKIRKGLVGETALELDMDAEGWFADEELESQEGVKATAVVVEQTR